MKEPHKFCHFCGHEYAGASWPRSCRQCAQETYQNPLPVVCVLVSVGGGLLVVRRDIEPQKGMLALPGGFIEMGESWQTAASRELHEETGQVVAPEAWHLTAIETTTKHFLVVCQTSLREMTPFVPNHEVSEVKVLNRAEELAFPLHTKWAKTFLGWGASVLVM